ncbi:MAG: hypothetical protein ACLTEH_00130 [Clostridia bacterium]
MKIDKGITMISLVITIIILIILAGITINTLIGDNGIITKTKQAKENTLLAQEEEARNLNELYVQLDKMDGNINVGDGDIGDKLLNFKKVIAQAITKEGVDTQETDSEEVMANHIGKILQERTKEATATENDVLEGKTAWVNGNKITGTNKGYDAGVSDGVNASSLHRVTVATDVGNGSYSVTDIPNYEKLTTDNFFFVITSTDIYSQANMQGYVFRFNESNTTPVVNYDATTGTVTLTGCSTSGSNYQGSGHTILKGNLYCVY